MAASDSIDSKIQDDVATFVRLDTELKRARKQMKEVRGTMNESRDRVVEYMRRTKTDKIVGINNGTQYLECVCRTLKKRATVEQMVAAVDEAIRQGVTDPVKMVEIIQNCGGTYEEYRLSRRTRRISAIAAAAVAASVAKAKKRRVSPQ